MKLTLTLLILLLIFIQGTTLAESTLLSLTNKKYRVPFIINNNKRTLNTTKDGFIFKVVKSSRWVLKSADIDVAGGMVCNTAAFSIEKLLRNKIRLEEIGSTLISCGYKAGELEDLFLDAISKVNIINISENTFSLGNEDKSVLVVFKEI